MRGPFLALAILLGFFSSVLADVVENDVISKFVPEQICCILKEGYTIEEVNERWGTTTIEAMPEIRFYLLRAEGVVDLLAFIEQMATDEAIELVEPNWFLETPEGVRQMVVTMIGGTYEEYLDQTMTVRIGLHEVHAMTQGEGVTVAVLDTGVDPSHEVLSDRLAPYRYDCIDHDHEPWETANGLDDDGDRQIDEGFGHGTMVAGLVALIAPESRIMPIRVLDDEGCGTLFNVARGFILASAHGADVINASFGTPHVIEVIRQALHVASMHDAMIVAGAGNRNQEHPPYFPACDEAAFMVTAVDSADVKADFADFSTLVHVSAPGVGLRSAYPGGWANGSGCSFATPLVAGETALLLSLEPGLDPEAVGAALAAAIEPIYGIPGNARYIGKLGTGRIYLPRVLATGAVPSSASDGPRVHVWPNPARGDVRLDCSPGGEVPWRLAIFDAAGRLVHLGEPATGERAVWSARDRAGRRVPPGTYFVKLTSGRQAATATVAILR